MDNFNLNFSGRPAVPKPVDKFNLSFYALSDEEVFRASFEDASGRDPLSTALLDRLPARKLAGHNVICYQYPPMLHTRTIPVRIEDYHKLECGRMIWIKDPLDPVFKMGRWAQIQGRRFGANPIEVEINVRISDHLESFLEPEQ